MKHVRHIEFSSDSAIIAGRPYIVSLYEHQEFF